MTVPPAPRQADHVPVWWIPLLAAAGAVVVYHGALGYFFGQDDFLSLARARGLVPRLVPPWRWLSGQLYFDLMRPLGVASATPYHAVSLATHAAVVALLAGILQRRFAPAAALAGALFFGAHPGCYTAVYSVSGIGELLSGLFALGTIATASLAGPARWAALPLFAVALLSKESVLLLPLALWPASGWLATPSDTGRAALASRRGVNLLLVVLGALSLSFAAGLVALDVFGVRSHLGTSAPYAVTLGPHVIANAATYLGWTANCWILTMKYYGDAVDPVVFPYAALAGLLWLAGLGIRGLRSRGWLAGGLTFAVLLAPVLGLTHHTYHYYLYVPLIGAAWCVTAVFDLALDRRPARMARPGGRAAPRTPPPRRGVVAAALLFAAVCVLNGLLLVHKIETVPFLDRRMRTDAVIDRSRIARRVRDGLAAATLPPGTSLVFWSPGSMRETKAWFPQANVAIHETYWELNVRSALMDGLAIHVLFPELGPVSFVHLDPAPAAGARVVLYEPDGSLEIPSPSALDSIRGALRSDGVVPN
jgi:hypothetical protein